MNEENVRRLLAASEALETALGYTTSPWASGLIDVQVTLARGLIMEVLGTVEAQAPKLVLTRAEQTCFGVPSQWDAWDEDGSQYYLRYRWGHGRVDLRAQMIDGNLDWLDHGSRTIAEFDNNDPLDGVIALEEFARRAGIGLADGVR